jgi:hypothetical protein
MFQLACPIHIITLAVWLLSGKLSCGQQETQVDETSPNHYNVIVYRATPGGIAAAIAAKETIPSCKVLLIEPTSHVGGMASEGGIGLRDAFTNQMRSDPRSSQYRWGRLNAKHFGIDGFVWQRDNWVGEQSFLVMLENAGVEMRLDTNFVEGEEGVHIVGGPLNRIDALLFEDGTVVSADYFIDASYEGEFMQASGVDWTFGRESASTYDEPWGGTGNFSASQFPGKLNPFGADGRLLKYVKLGKDVNTQLGEADEQLMSYSYRVCLTKDKDIAVPLTPPANYNPQDFELARRLIRRENAMNRSLSEPWLYMEYSGYRHDNNSFVKYDACCGGSPIGIDAIGLSVGYATATRSERIKIADMHRYYVQGLLWFWQSDPSVPESVRMRHKEYGLCGDEWIDNSHFPRQLYVREAARLVGDRVFTQNDRLPICRPDSIAVCAWGLDQHDMQRIAYYDGTDWVVKNEGLRGDAKQQGGVFPFEIPYWAILPKRKQLANLAVVNCPSMSHVAFSAIRVEPALWLLGQAAGTAAIIASSFRLDSLHDIDIQYLQRSLQNQGAVIHVQDNGTCETHPPEPGVTHSASLET